MIAYLQGNELDVWTVIMDGPHIFTKKNGDKDIPKPFK